jgi:hypothetical protein
VLPAPILMAIFMAVLRTVLPNFMILFESFDGGFWG